jgi:hypothetical protein
MNATTCRHQWDMIDTTYGFLVTEKCFHCGMISTEFSLDPTPPLEEYREGDHTWNLVESAQTIRYNLNCRSCGLRVDLKGLLGLMVCTGCDPVCEVDGLRRRFEPERRWVYVAFGFLPEEKHVQLTDEKIAALEEYINQLRRSRTSSIKIVPGRMVSKIQNCYGEVIKDTDMLSLTPPNS